MKLSGLQCRCCPERGHGARGSGLRLFRCTVDASLGRGFESRLSAMQKRCSLSRVRGLKARCKCRYRSRGCRGSRPLVFSCSRDSRVLARFSNSRKTLVFSRDLCTSARLSCSRVLEILVFSRDSRVLANRAFARLVSSRDSRALALSRFRDTSSFVFLCFCIVIQTSIQNKILDLEILNKPVFSCL